MLSDSEASRSFVVETIRYRSHRPDVLREGITALVMAGRPLHVIMYNEQMPSILFRAHAVQRMFERGISVSKVRKALETADVIEDYSSEMPEPSRLIMGFQGKRPFHVVTSENLQADEITVVTVYLPDANKWKKDYRSRK